MAVLFFSTHSTDEDTCTEEREQPVKGSVTSRCRGKRSCDKCPTWKCQGAVILWATYKVSHILRATQEPDTWWVSSVHMQVFGLFGHIQWVALHLHVTEHLWVPFPQDLEPRAGPQGSHPASYSPCPPCPAPETVEKKTLLARHPNPHSRPPPAEQCLTETERL